MRTADGVYALRYAYRTASLKGEHFYGHPADCCEPWPIDYYTWVAIHHRRVVVVDAGFTPQTAEERGDRPYVATPVELLRRLGVGADEVDDLVLTHLHYDHTGHLDRYPNARIFVQRREREFWRSPFAVRGANTHLHRPGDLAELDRLDEAGRVRQIDGDHRLDECITLHLVGGHTAGMQVVRVADDNGPVVLASDASHFYANVEQDWPYGVVHDLPAMHAAFDTLVHLAGDRGVIVPGHDPRVRERHHAMAGTDGAITRLSPTPNDPVRGVSV
ncbi:N-acyl homoserine lactonase family protein [Mycolicibacterium sp. S2-37]|uniref:N-acyl homoserine lactonase family protein n=1 Tax=Mycolicibacterium sp. S2-37 TaxID=2810297 RepID=UPI001A94E008|nr:N-acyl homoserine lactonase family protein [Mycolicibacterium sp. S2-37]MBO0679653.1 N-acyl homoserine lactonase family protein [Mycolicibacterium sp. S2-37]